MEIFNKIQEIGIFLTPVFIVLALFIVHKLKKSGVKIRPSHYSHEGYYEIVRGFNGGYEESSLLKRPVQSSEYFYLRSEPFDIEVSVDSVMAADGKKYRAIAVTTVYLPYDKAEQVIKKYYTALYLKGYCDKLIDAELSELLEGVLEGVVSRLNGTESTEDAKKEFMAKAMEAAMLCSHLVSAVPTFSFVKIKE